MRIAFVGFRHGHIYVLYEMAKNHKDIEIVGSFEENEEARNAAAENGVDISYTSLDELLFDERVEAVAIGSCYGDRGAIAIKALKAGKHVICDKPLCTELSELYEIKKLAEEKDLTVSCMFTMRFENKVNAVRDLIRSGALGEINNVYFGGQHPLQYGRRPSWYFEDGKHGGVINDIAIHGIDLLSYLFDGKLDVINGARCWNKYAENEKDFKDSAQIMLTLKNNAGVIADLSYAIPDGVEFELPYYWQFYIWGTKGTISFSMNGEKTVWFAKGEKEGRELVVDPIETDYLSDFIRVVKKEKDVVLPMSEVISSTEATLLIQKKADALQ